MEIFTPQNPHFPFCHSQENNGMSCQAFKFRLQEGHSDLAKNIPPPFISRGTSTEAKLPKARPVMNIKGTNITGPAVNIWLVNENDIGYDYLHNLHR